jgi:hypothetical protein
MSLSRHIRARLRALHQRLINAWHVLRAPHYVVYFDYTRPIPEEGSRGMNGGWRGLRRQDLYDLGTWCFEMLVEDDECNNLLDEVNDLLDN